MDETIHNVLRRKLNVKLNHLFRRRFTQKRIHEPSTKVIRLYVIQMYNRLRNKAETILTLPAYTIHNEARYWVWMGRQ